jgi:hypothetical protein
MVHNYRYLNSFCKNQTCRYEEVKDLHKVLRPHDWLFRSRRHHRLLTCPVTPSYSVLPQLSSDASGVIRERFRPHRPGASSTRGLLGVTPRLRGTISGSGKNVCNTVVRIHQPPFISKVIKVLSRAMRTRGIRCLWFIDDCLLALPSRSLAFLTRKTVEDLFVCSGLTRAPDKGSWVTTQTLPDHLGVDISTVSANG